MLHIVILLFCVAIGVYAHHHPAGGIVGTVEKVAERVAESEVESEFHVQQSTSRKIVEAIESDI